MKRKLYATAAAVAAAAAMAAPSSAAAADAGAAPSSAVAADAGGPPCGIKPLTDCLRWLVTWDPCLSCEVIEAVEETCNRIDPVCPAIG